MGLGKNWAEAGENQSQEGLCGEDSGRAVCSGDSGEGELTEQAEQTGFFSSCADPGDRSSPLCGDKMMPSSGRR